MFVNNIPVSDCCCRYMKVMQMTRGTQIMPGWRHQSVTTMMEMEIYYNTLILG